MEYKNSPTVIPDETLTTKKILINGGRDERIARIEVILCAIIIALALFGNAVVIYVLWRKRKNLSRLHFFIFHLCVADVISALCSQFPQMLEEIFFHFRGPSFACKLMKFWAMFPMYLSTFILTLTAIDRYLAICHPLLGFRGRQTFRMRLMVVSAWILAAIFATPQMFLFDVKYIEQWQSFQCWINAGLKGMRAYLTIFSLVVLILPSLLMAIIYGLICDTVWTRMGNTNGDTKQPKFTHYRNCSLDDDDQENTSGDGIQMKASSNHGGKSSKIKKQNQLYRSHTAESRVSRAKVKTVKMTLTIVSVYIICWAPFVTSKLWEVWALRPLGPVWLDPVLTKLANLNACTNPWIYLSFSGCMPDTMRVIRNCLRYIGCKKLNENPKPHPSGHHGEETTSRYISYPTGTRATSVFVTNDIKDGHRVDSNGNRNA